MRRPLGVAVDVVARSSPSGCSDHEDRAGVEPSRYRAPAYQSPRWRLRRVSWWADDQPIVQWVAPAPARELPGPSVRGVPARRFFAPPLSPRARPTPLTLSDSRAARRRRGDPPPTRCGRFPASPNGSAKPRGRLSSRVRPGRHRAPDLPQPRRAYSCYIPVLARRSGALTDPAAGRVIVVDDGSTTVRGLLHPTWASRSAPPISACPRRACSPRPGVRAFLMPMISSSLEAGLQVEIFATLASIRQQRLRCDAQAASQDVEPCTSLRSAPEVGSSSSGSGRATACAPSASACVAGRVAIRKPAYISPAATSSPRYR